MSEKINVGDIVKLTGEGQGYVYGHFKGINNCSVGLIVKKYIYEDGDEISNGQYVYDLLIGNQVIPSLFNDEICKQNV